ncbi:hypothetical protein [Rhodococcus daqingensis]|uniref:Uncharacterized protein n=1 Tax=Rhodococcus daqingensis TaxID=2479363 RepID=A0ABW2S602_9NOCA
MNANLQAGAPVGAMPAYSSGGQQARIAVLRSWCSPDVLMGAGGI